MGCEFIPTSDRLEESLPLMVVVDAQATIAVPCVIRAAMGAENPAVSHFADRRIERAAAQMIAQDELRHGFEHRDLDGLPLTRALPMNDRGEHGGDRAHSDKPIDERERHITRLFRAYPHCERR